MEHGELVQNIVVKFDLFIRVYNTKIRMSSPKNCWCTYCYNTLKMEDECTDSISHIQEYDASAPAPVPLVPDIPSEPVQVSEPKHNDDAHIPWWMENSRINESIKRCVDTTTDSWIPGTSHNPSAVAKYTLTVTPSGMATLDIQKWDNTFRRHLFWTHNVIETYSEMDKGIQHRVVIKMQKNTLSFDLETMDETNAFHQYLFNQIGR